MSCKESSFTVALGRSLVAPLWWNTFDTAHPSMVTNGCMQKLYTSKSDFCTSLEGGHPLAALYPGTTSKTWFWGFFKQSTKNGDNSSEKYLRHSGLPSLPSIPNRRVIQFGLLQNSGRKLAANCHMTPEMSFVLGKASTITTTGSMSSIDPSSPCIRPVACNAGQTHLFEIAISTSNFIVSAGSRAKTVKLKLSAFFGIVFPIPTVRALFITFFSVVWWLIFFTEGISQSK